jgi:hypothetical protein
MRVRVWVRVTVRVRVRVRASVSSSNHLVSECVGVCKRIGWHVANHLKTTHRTNEHSASGYLGILMLRRKHLTSQTNGGHAFLSVP